jgi:NAD(P)H-dependent FMN reductase
MSKRILALGASNSRNSINKQFAYYTANQIEGNHDLIDLNDFEMPLYGIDREKENGIPELAHEFRRRIGEADALIMSFAEHNGAYTVAFKNVFDWVSRIDQDVWQNKPMLLLSTSPGGRGGLSVLELAEGKFRRMTKNTLLTFSLPFFSKNFSEQGIQDTDLRAQYLSILEEFRSAI